MALQDDVFENNIDTRSPKEKQSDIGGALLMAGSFVGLIAARKKLAITRGVSKDILGAGLKNDSRYGKYITSSPRSRKSGPVKSLRETLVDNVKESKESFVTTLTDLARPLPSDQESYAISVQFLNKNLGHPVDVFPEWEKLALKESSFAHKIYHGPRVVPFAPGATLGMVSRKNAPKTVGKYGALLIDNNLHFLLDPRKARRLGSFYDPNATIKGARVGIVNSWGSNMERQRRGLVKSINPRTVEEHVRKVTLGTRSIIDAERKAFVQREYMERFFPGTSFVKGRTMEDFDKIIASETEKRQLEIPEWQTPRFFNKISGEHEPIPTLKQFMGHRVSSYELTKNSSLTFNRKLLEDAAKTRRLISSKASNTLSAKAGFAAFKLGRKIGISEEFASHGAGFPQRAERWLRRGGQWNYKHPVTGEMIDVHPRRYNVAGINLGSGFKGSESPWYITTPRDTVLRNLNVLSSGTLHKVWESASGLGISSRPNFATNLAKGILGAKTGSWSDIFIRNLGKTARVIGVGLGAYYSYQGINALARKATGWGPNDIAASAYVHYREFQQHVLSDLGIVHLAKSTENAFPGSISSPASYALRLLTPAILARSLGRRYGPGGFATGLATGIAFALITWGDLTQTPEELHRIFTGEDEVPVRKGRYWIMGNTPFFGDKISYWRPHWYPLMKSHYQYKGQLWDSEDDYWQHGSIFAPVLSPLTTGKLWDPYYWEHKHYSDRPYPITGELFEPTMPFATIGNATIGKLIKPPVLMHKEYLGTEQRDSSEAERGLPLNIGPSLGYPSLSGTGITGADSPYSARYQLGELAYSQAEQMGLLGYSINTFWNKLSGQQDFMSSQSVLQSSRRATGYEREYWQKELGDPGAGLEEGLTEYFRRLLPHRRSNVEEYNPIKNQMPSWLPGEDYFINFRQGDPYIKIPFGEARLPGAGYESLHALHSGTPGVYDPVDRFLILANVAPYSDEYKQYRKTAIGMTRTDEDWAKIVNRVIDQRNALNNEYKFLDMSTDGVPSILKPASSIYRHALGAIGEAPNPLDVLPMNIAVWGIPAHQNKWLPYKTPESEYRDFRLYGSEYQRWDRPVESFIVPVVDKARRIADPDYVPRNVQRQREIEEYFDALKYIKYSNLAQVARFQGNSELASKLSRISRYTMASGNYNPGVAMASIPRGERSFYKPFSEAEGSRREHILGIVPDYMKPYYMTAWNNADGKKTYNVDYHSAENLTAYFKTHYLPSADWEGWHPDVSLNQVKLRTVKNEAFDIHKFNLWESNERQLSRQPFTPLIENINAPSNDMTMLQNTMVANMEKLGLTNSRVYITRTPASENSHKIKITIDKDTSDDNNNAMNSVLSVG